MSLEKNRALARRYIKEIRNRGNLAAVNEIIAKDFTHHSLEGDKNPDDFRRYVVELCSAFPDIHFKIEDMVAEKDKVVVRCTVTGTHKGEFIGIPATDKSFRIPGTSIIRFAGGKVAEIWPFWDRLNLLKQVGVVLHPDR